MGWFVFKRRRFVVKRAKAVARSSDNEGLSSTACVRSLSALIHKLWKPSSLSAHSSTCIRETQMYRWFHSISPPMTTGPCKPVAIWWILLLIQLSCFSCPAPCCILGLFCGRLQPGVKRQWLQRPGSMADLRQLHTPLLPCFKEFSK